MPNFHFMEDRNLPVSVLEMDALEINLLMEFSAMMARELREKRDRIEASKEIGFRHAAAVISADEQTIDALMRRLQKAKQDAIRLNEARSGKDELFAAVRPRMEAA